MGEGQFKQGRPHTLSDFCEHVPDELRPPLDRESVDGPLTVYQQCWRDGGYLILPGFIPPALIDAYAEAFEFFVVNNGTTGNVGNPAAAAIGLGIGTPYMQVSEIRDLCLYAPLMEILRGLIGGDMGMHLNLTGWKSTERNWHQDDYLNPDYINGHYAAVWFALDDIHPDAGPFEFVPQSHARLDVCRGEKVRAALPTEKQNADWPRAAEAILDDLYEAEIERLGLRVQSWCGQKGDVLIWHPWLLHRGSRPKNPDLLRPTIITHYSAISHRRDMPNRAFWDNGESRGHYFVF